MNTLDQDFEWISSYWGFYLRISACRLPERNGPEQSSLRAIDKDRYEVLTLYLMYKLHEKRPRNGMERFKKVFTLELLAKSRSVAFAFTTHFSETSTILNRRERNASRRTRVNTCKKFFGFSKFHIISFSCARGLR